MSSSKGNTQRTRSQKYKNSFAFKNDLHDTTPKIKMLNALHICEVCEQCKKQIEWKIKYRKYKPLSKPRACNFCGERTVKRAYHVICRPCGTKNQQCAKCLKTKEELQDIEIVPPEPTDQEKLELQLEMDRLVKNLPERKRRTFLRYMKKGKPRERKEGDEEEIEEPAGGEDDEEGGEKVKRVYIKYEPHTRDELMLKFETLNVATNATAGGESDDDDSDIDSNYSDIDSDFENY